MPPRTLALLIICLIANMPHLLLTLVFEPLVIAINCPVYPTPPKTFFITQMLKGYGTIGTRQDNGLAITLPAYTHADFKLCTHALFTHSRGRGRSPSQSQVTRSI